MRSATVNKLRGRRDFFATAARAMSMAVVAAAVLVAGCVRHRSIPAQAPAKASTEAPRSSSAGNTFKMKAQAAGTRVMGHWNGSGGDVHFTFEVKGVGIADTDEHVNAGKGNEAKEAARADAMADAHEKARQQAVDFFLQRNSQFDYPGAEDDLRALLNDEHLKEREHKDLKIEFTRIEDDRKLVALVTVPMEVKLSAQEYRELVRKDREYLAAHRQVRCFPILIGVAALFGAVGLYYRVNEATRGRYSNWTRTAALMLAALLGLGSWLMS